jgi:hypothetical protein
MKERSASEQAHKAFVNALRACLDLEPLYDRTKESRDVERFGRAHVYHWAPRGYTDTGQATRKGSGA